MLSGSGVEAQLIACEPAEARFEVGALKDAVATVLNLRSAWGASTGSNRTAAAATAVGVLVST